MPLTSSHYDQTVAPTLLHYLNERAETCPAHSLRRQALCEKKIELDVTLYGVLIASEENGSHTDPDHHEHGDDRGDPAAQGHDEPSNGCRKT